MSNAPGPSDKDSRARQGETDGWAGGRGAGSQLLRDDVPIVLDESSVSVPTADDRAEALEQEVAQLRHASELKDAYLRTVAHDLQNPLSVIKGMGQTLVEHDRRLPEHLAAELAQTIVRQAARVLSTLDDLLSLDRLSMSRPEPVREDVDIAELILACVAELDSDTPIEVELESVEASLDRGLISRVVENMLRNAIQHQRDQTPVQIAVRRLDDPPGWFSITVSDHGPGVRPEDRERMFHPYFHGDRRGVGLSIVRLFTELHGGDVRVEDAAEGGTAFSVRMPGRAEPAEPADDAV